MKQAFTLFTILLFSTCKQQEEKKQPSSNIDSTRYNNLILNIAMCTPEFLSNKYQTRIDEKWFKRVKELVLRKKEVSDTKLGITLRLHEWTYDGGQSFPNFIIYVSNGKDFEYAFPFLDEYYYDLNGLKKENNEVVQYMFKQHWNFFTQLNYITSKLELNKPSRIKELNTFVSLLTDSLLVMKELKLKDIDYLKDRLDRVLTTNDTSRKFCLENVSKNINSIISDLENNKDQSIRYFLCSEGANAFWKFKFINNDSTIIIQPTVENKECYECVFF